MKVKVFDCNNEIELTNKLNDFIKDIEKDNMEVVDIKYSLSTFVVDHGDDCYCFSALVMYRPVINYELKLWDEIPETLKASCIVKEEK